MFVVKEILTINGVNYDVYYLVCKDLNMKIRIKTNEKYAIEQLVNYSKNCK